jgi:hypothetical protein
LAKDDSIMYQPPSRSKGILSDIRLFILHRPKTLTHIKFKSAEDRKYYEDRIIQRLGVNVEKYSVLNVHQIGIDVPPHYSFEELLNWNGDSTCWPNHIARVSRINNKLETIQIYLFGRKRLWFGLSPLFDLDAIKIQRVPGTYDLDNARYLLYKCSGGYPIGIFYMYVRSPEAEQKEAEPSQLFFVVGFNFYGKEYFSRITLINRIWEAMHDRVTANTMVRFKKLCEWRFNKIQEGNDV